MRVTMPLYCVELQIKGKEQKVVVETSNYSEASSRFYNIIFDTRREFPDLIFDVTLYKDWEVLMSHHEGLKDAIDS